MNLELGTEEENLSEAKDPKAKRKGQKETTWNLCERNRI